MRITAGGQEGGIIADHHLKYRKCDSGHKVAPLGYSEPGKYFSLSERMLLKPSTLLPSCDFRHPKQGLLCDVLRLDADEAL